MAASGAAGRDSGHRNLQGLAIEHCDDPPDRTNEARAIETRPGHRAWPGQIVHCARKDGDQDLLCSPSELGLLAGEVLTLGSLNQVESIDMDALLLGKAQGRACRRADGIVGHGFGRSSYFDLYVSL